MAKHRVERVNDLVMRELSEVIRNLKDPRIPLMASVVRVTVTPDLKFAKAHISVFGDEAAKKDCIAGLTSAAGFIRREMSSRVDLRATPEFSFVIDDGVEHGAYIAKKLQDLHIPPKETDEETDEESDEGTDEGTV